MTHQPELIDLIHRLTTLHLEGKMTSTEYYVWLRQAAIDPEFVLALWR
ncbi:hypothetical protein [Sulfobacillus thermosulfidooxidans]|uniref:Uncharacterized protein n=1 Tax=Sulfobacillus thermosulfidooxidans (strain DSM 9293 / VKM B-1269 / AT-1) TaxID=929705 RepID=A0A1W1W8Q4_SULTA|nr:hypothetical protein [Sulfobacillus thermosulfidooxidans]SMC02582.1 hypothetical protein SAMN00768000_0665 [Sulfobacillus thermosulfidooxidans DSM 9293]